MEDFGYGYWYVEVDEDYDEGGADGLVQIFDGDDNCILRVNDWNTETYNRWSLEDKKKVAQMVMDAMHGPQIDLSKQYTEDETDD